MENSYPTLFITHRGKRHQHDSLAAAPSELEITIKRSPTKEEIIALLPGKKFLISERSGEIDADIIAAGKDLLLIQRLGSMTYDIDLESARNAGIAVSSLPVQSAIMVAEHMIMQLLACAKRLREMMDITHSAEDYGKPSRLSDEDYFAYNWSNRKDIRGLRGSTVGILGFGEIGAEVARRLQGFGSNIIYNKRNPLPASAEEDLHIKYASKEDLVSTSDYVCMLLPYFPETALSLSDQFFAKMKQGAIFVSCGGSGVVDEKALTRALLNQHLYGAAIDTYTYEPIAKNDPLLPLVNDPRFNLILTPHIAAGSGLVGVKPGEERAGDYVNIMRLLAGKEILGRVA
ncbi:MAG: hypothetical protein BGO78_13325 [Chloroflexi bacterium 44-23]|nr:MAG: hypothetical protein BGO78_13325 [Chloroflexi bacterium 44-23]